MTGKPTEVLLVIVNTEYGGGQRTFEILTRGLLQGPFTVHVACDANEPFWTRMGELGACRHAVGFDRAWGPLRVVQLARIIKRERIHVVHSQSRRADFYALLAARLCRVPAISSVAVRIEAFDVSSIRKRLYRWLEAWMEPRFTRHITVSRAVERAMLDAGIPPERVVRIPEAVETDRVQPDQFTKLAACRQFGLDPSLIWVGALGRMVPLKGHRLFLEAAGHLRERTDVGFLLAGTGPQEDSLKVFATQLHLEDRLRLLPFQEDPSLFYSALDLVVFPSLFGEAFPRVLLEAMLYGKPIVASDLPACREVLGAGPFARFFPAGDAPALAAAVREFCQHPHELERVGALARAYVVEHYDVRHFVPRVMETYRAALGLGN